LGVGRGRAGSRLATTNTQALRAFQFGWLAGYSTLLVAALRPSPLDGAGVMALFAFGSGVSLMAGPWLWLRLRAHGSGT